MNSKLTSGTLSPHVREYYNQLMTNPNLGFGCGPLTGLRDCMIDIAQLGPTEDELRCPKWRANPYVDMFDSYSFVMGGCFGLKRIDIARASRLWEQLVEPDVDQILSFEDMVNFAHRFVVEPDKTRFPSPMMQSLQFF